MDLILVSVIFSLIKIQLWHNLDKPSFLRQFNKLESQKQKKTVWISYTDKFNEKIYHLQYMVIDCE